MTEVFEAVRNGDLDAVTRIVEADPAATRLRNEAGLTPVMLAAYHGRKEILALLLAHAGRDLDIFEASTVGIELRMTELIAADARCVAARSADGFTPLHLAAYFGQEGAVKELLNHGADPNAVAENDMRVQPVHSAVAAGQRRIAGLLIAAGADVNAAQHGGFTPLIGAAHNGDVDMIELLRSAGATLSAQTDDGKTAEDFAREQGHAEAVRALSATA